MKLALLACLALLVCSVPAGADERISLAKVKRLNREQVQLQCFDTCVSRDIHYCKRVGRVKARCVSTVVFTDHAGTTSCRVTNRWKLKDGAPVIYEINKRCHPA